MLYKNALVGIITALVYSSGIAFGASATRGGSLRISTSSQTPTTKTSVAQPATPQMVGNPTRVSESYGDAGLVKLNKLTGSTAEARNILNALENRVNDLSVGYNSLDNQYEQLSTDVDYASKTATSAKTIAESARDQLNRKMNYGDFNTAFDARATEQQLADQPYVANYVDTNVQKPDLSNYYNKASIDQLLDNKINKGSDFSAMFTQQLANQNLADAATVDAVSDHVTSVENKVTAVENKINSAQQSINAITEQNTTTANKITAAENQISELANKITTAEQNINSAAEQNATTANKITAAENQISELANKITTAEGNITTAAQQNTTTANKVTALENKITSMEASNETLTQFKDNVALTADNLSSKVPELFQQINAATAKAEEALAQAGSGTGTPMDQSTFNTYLENNTNVVFKDNADFVGLKDNALTPSNFAAKMNDLMQRLSNVETAAAEAKNTANSASELATNAKNTAESVSELATSAKTTAEGAAALATNAKNAADSAATLATNAKNSADSAAELAASAKTTAESASELATNAKTTAEGAAALAGEAKDLAETADAKAQQALDRETAN